MSEEAKDPKDQNEQDEQSNKEEVNPTQDATEVLLRRVAAEISEKSVNYAIIINDGASPRWIVSDVYWMMGVLQLISRRIEADWDEDFFAERDEDEEE